MKNKISKFSRFLLATVCFSSAVVNIFATEPHQAVNNMDPLFTKEFSENSVKEYANFYGIKFDDAKDTLGYQANYNKLSVVVQNFNECLEQDQWHLSYRDRNCLATLVFATMIGLEIQNFERCDKKDITSMVYSYIMTSLDNNLELEKDKQYQKGIGFINTFHAYNMMLNTCSLNHCFSIKNNFASANGKLKKLLSDRLEADKDLIADIFLLLKNKFGDTIKSATDILTFMQKNSEALNNKFFSKIKCYFARWHFSEKTKPIHTSANAIASSYKPVKSGISIIEKEIISSKMSIIKMVSSFPEEERRQEFSDLEKTLKYISVLFDNYGALEYNILSYYDLIDDLSKIKEKAIQLVTTQYNNIFGNEGKRLAEVIVERSSYYHKFFTLEQQERQILGMQKRNKSKLTDGDWFLGPDYLMVFACLNRNSLDYINKLNRGPLTPNISKDIISDISAVYKEFRSAFDAMKKNKVEYEVLCSEYNQKPLFKKLRDEIIYVILPAKLRSSHI